MEATHMQRRHDIDWLRNLALCLLIFYHIGMYYVLDWGWHIKSDQQSEWLQDVMILSNQWRMSLLFFVSGMTLALVEHKYRRRDLLSVRVKRLFIPLLFGMLVIVPPQLYYELLWSGRFDGSYGAFLLEYLNLGTSLAPEKQSVLGLLTWNHLWYLAYLFVYSLLFLVVRPLLQALVSASWFRQCHPLWLIAVAVLSLLVVWLMLRQSFPVTHALVDDWYNHGKSFTVMLLGYVLVHRTDIWQQIIERRVALFVTALCTYALIIADRHGAFPEFAQAYQTSDWARVLAGVILVVNLWCWLLTMVGMSGRYLNQSSRWLGYANQAVLPWYILHQSVIIVLAVQLAAFDVPVVVEAVILVVGTFAVCALGFEVIRRVYVLRLLFGIKNNHKPETCEQGLARYTG